MFISNIYYYYHEMNRIIIILLCSQIPFYVLSFHFVKKGLSLITNNDRLTFKMLDHWKKSLKFTGWFIAAIIALYPTFFLFKIFVFKALREFSNPAYLYP